MDAMTAKVVSDLKEAHGLVCRALDHLDIKLASSAYEKKLWKVIRVIDRDMVNEIENIEDGIYLRGIK